MEKTEQVDTVIGEQDKEIIKCGSRKGRFFKLNGWKTTFLILLVK